MYKIWKKGDEDDERRRLLILSALALAVLLFALLIALIILLAVDDVPVGVFIEMTEEKKLNFTDANDECKKLLGPYGRLVVFDNEDEEAKFVQGYLSQSEEYLKICPTAFIGFRIRYLEKLSRMSKTQIMLPFEFSSPGKMVTYHSSEFPCRKAEFSDPIKLTVKETILNCSGKEFFCILCEVIPKFAYAKEMDYLKRCPPSYPICYIVRYPEGEDDISYDELLEMCDRLDARIAFTSTDGLTQGQKTRMATKTCRNKNTVMVSAPSVTVVETIDGVEMKYRSKRLEPGTSINNCVVVTTLDKKYPLIFDSCFSKHCYACQVAKPKGT